MYKLYIAMILLYGGGFMAGLTGLGLWAIPVISGVMLGYIAWSRPKMIETVGGLIGVWAIQLVLSSLVLGFGWGLRHLLGLEFSLHPAIPIAVSAAGLAFAMLAGVPRGEDLDSLDAFIDEVTDEIEAIEKDDSKSD